HSDPALRIYGAVARAVALVDAEGLTAELRRAHARLAAVHPGGGGLIAVEPHALLSELRLRRALQPAIEAAADDERGLEPDGVARIEEPEGVIVRMLQIAAGGHDDAIVVRSFRDHLGTKTSGRVRRTERLRRGATQHLVALRVVRRIAPF